MQQTGMMPASSTERAVTGALTAGVLVVYALRGGTYDVVVRGEAAVVLLWGLLLGLAAGLLPRRRLSPEALIWLASLLLLGLWTMVGFQWTSSDERTSIELARIGHHLGLAALVLCLVRRTSAATVVAGAAVAGVIVCAVAFGARTWPEAFPADTVQRIFLSERLSYPLNYWNAVGAWGAMATAMALTFSVHVRSAAWRAAALAAVPLCVCTVYLTYSRAGAIGVAVGVVLVAALSRTRVLVAIHAVVAAAGSLLVILAVRDAPDIADGVGTDGRGTVWLALVVALAACAAAAAVLYRLGADERLSLTERVPRRIAAGLLALVVLAGVAASIPIIDRAIDDFNGPTTVVSGTADDDPAARLGSLHGTRRVTYESAIDASRAEPLHGIGAGTFEFWWNRDAVNAQIVRDAHSLYLEALAETGWPGLVLVLLFCGTGLYALFRWRRRPSSRSEAGAATAALVAFVLWLIQSGVDWIWESTAVTALAITVAAASFVGAGRGDAVRLPWPARAGAALVCLLLLLVQLSPLVGTSKVRESQRKAAAGQADAALAAASDAAAAWPWAAAPYAQLALLDEAAGDFADAELQGHRAWTREPLNWRHPLLLARIAAEQDRPRAAVRLFEQARELFPLGRGFQ